ncbi:MAG: efflux RND transporter permease subunit [Candidatus Hydrogenedentes bacterium]|nr:efflux RND transporter permease subunit [Candidatus Hydrogenedentota bacterium]
MLNAIVAFSLNNRLLLSVIFVACAVLGVWTLTLIPIDAFPDTTPVQVQINTVAPALNPLEIEQQITAPIELSISGLPGLANVRSISKFGLSQVVATFDDSISIYTARQFIMERINGVALPEGMERPQLGPISTGLGEVFHYVIRSDNPERTLDELRTLHDWVIKPELRKVPGVAEVNSWGGYERQYQVIVSPEGLVKHGLSLDDVTEALEANNRNVGGGQVIAAGEALLVHGLGRVFTLEQIGNVVLKAHAGVPVRIRDVAEIALGHEIRHGAVTAQGRGEVVLGLGFMLMGENSRVVTEALKRRLESVQASLPEDIKVEIVYDRTELVREVMDTVWHNLFLGAILVVAILFLILGNVRAGLLVAITIPLAMVFAVLGMYQAGIAASLLSLGAMDFGILVDGSVVTTEINLRRLREKRRQLGRPLDASERLHTILQSSLEVVRPIVFGMFIIAIVFCPVLSLQGIEGKLFKPMAWTFIFALIGALLTGLMLTPILSYCFLPRRFQEREGLIERLMTAAYTPFLRAALRWRKTLFLVVIIILGVTVMTARTLGGEFVPRLSEGAIVFNVIRLAGISVEEAAESNTRMERLLLKQFPDEIRYIWSRCGTAEVATDPMGVELSDVFVALQPRDHWKRARTQQELATRMEAALQDFPGQNIVFTQPIEMRMNELIAGMRADVGIKIYGDDFDTLVRVSDRVQEALLDIDGAADVSGDQITGQPMLQLAVNPEKTGRYGIPTANVLQFIETVGGLEVGEIFEGQRRFPLAVRLPERQRRDIAALSDTLVATPSGMTVPLRNLADIKETEGPATISREWGRRLIRVQCGVRGRDVASFVKEAQARIAEELELPEGYVVEWGGQFENLARTQRRLAIVVPLTLSLIFILLVFSMGRLSDVLIIYTGIPFAAVGAVFSLYLRGLPFSVSAAVGFIALSGIAVLNGQVLVVAIRKFLNQGLPLRDAVLDAARERLRPVLATAITDAAGFIPMALSTGVGAEVQRPLATVVIGGVLTSTLLTLFVLPALYLTVGKRLVAAPAQGLNSEQKSSGGSDSLSHAARDSE